MIPETNPASELEGFVVFDPAKIVSIVKEIAIKMNAHRARISAYALQYIGDPEYVIAFFDENQKRLMIIPGEKSMKNAVPLSINGTPKKCCISRGNFMKKIAEIAGIEYKKDFYYKISGHKVSSSVQPTLIFDLATIQPYEPRKVKEK